jgi:hypothetical protein
MTITALSYSPAYDYGLASRAAETGKGSNTEGAKKPQQSGELSEEERKEVQQLKARDAEVRAHESAHVASGGSYVRGGASFEYQTGPDGQQYAVGGEVSIDTSAVSGDPNATIRKMQTVQRAALAPASPSGQDRSVASQAAQAEAQARIETMKKNPSGGDGGETGKGAMLGSSQENAGYDSSGKAAGNGPRMHSSAFDLFA